MRECSDFDRERERELQFFVFLVLIWIISCYICWDVGRFCTVKLAAEITRERTVSIEIDGCAVLVLKNRAAGAMNQPRSFEVWVAL